MEPGADTSPRITSIDALRGFVMFMMIFVNDLAGGGKVVPNWMVHFSDRHPEGSSGMTFVDLVFPAFLFIVGMSIPFALGGRLKKGKTVWRVFGHVAVRTLSLLLIGILMVHETPDTAAMGWSGNWWCVLMYFSALAAFLFGGKPSQGVERKWDVWRIINICLRVGGVVMLLWLAFAFRGPKGQRIITLAPFSVDADWYGILGLIGWAYLVAASVFLIFRERQVAILGCMMLLMCLFIADRKGFFENFWLSKVVSIGEALGSQAAISVGGVLLGTMLTNSEATTLGARARFALSFAVGCGAAALLLNPLYGISKNNATPSWCLWACAITAVLWLGFYFVCDVRPVNWVWRPLSLAGRNVLTGVSAFRIAAQPRAPCFTSMNRMTASATSLSSAIIRAATVGVLLLFTSTLLNRIGFRLRL